MVCFNNVFLVPTDAVCKSELSRLEFLKGLYSLKVQVVFTNVCTYLLITDVNAYLKKIKKSGRKIQLALSRCNLAELQITLFSLQSIYQLITFLKLYLICVVLVDAFEVADKPEKCDVLIMDKGERTFKFLLGVASSKPLLSSRWLLSVKETRSIDVKPEHIFNDDKFERIYKFEPLYIMNKPYLLKGLNFLLGSSIQPSAKDMKGNTTSIVSLDFQNTYLCVSI